MKRIQITKDPRNKPNMFYATFPDLPGSPPAGFGKTCKEALGDLIYHSQKELDIKLEVPECELKRVQREYERAR